MDSQARLSFGKHRGKTFEQVQQSDKPYCDWALNCANPSDSLIQFISYLKQDHQPTNLPKNNQTIECKKHPLAFRLILVLSSPASFKVFSKALEGTTKDKRATSFLPNSVYTALLHFKRNSDDFPADSYLDVQREIHNKFDCDLELVPKFVLCCFPAFAKYVDRSRAISEPPTKIPESDITKIIEANQCELYKQLKPFQHAGLVFGLGRGGKVLIGDEMGLGKTLQALAIVAAYRSDWPVLIICPSSIRFQWKDQAITWLSPWVAPSQVFVVKTGKADIPVEAKIVVISYDLLSRHERFQRVYGIVICDESHYIKNSLAKRTLSITPLLKSAKRTLLLSGTPALNKPVELYQQVASLWPNFAGYSEFAKRYCEQEFNRYTKKFEFVGHQYEDELNTFLNQTVMIRRLKSDVQTELPPKLRSRIPVEIPASLAKQIQAIRRQMDEQNLEESGTRTEISQLFALTGAAKVGAVCEHITYLLESSCKFLLFAHHQSVMDDLEIFLEKQSVSHIRIDGNTKMDDREKAVKHFESDPTVMVALLSITACGHGLNLTSAGTVVFAELYWVPGQIIQAEDRSHRIGTTYSSVNIHYIVAEHSLDESVWQVLRKKWVGVTAVLDGVSNDFSATTVQPKQSPISHLSQSQSQEEDIPDVIILDDEINLKSPTLPMKRKRVRLTQKKLAFSPQSG